MEVTSLCKWVCSLMKHLTQPATAHCMNEPSLLNGRLPSTTLLTSTEPANLQDADEESCAEEGWLDGESLEQRIRVRAKTTRSLVST